LNWKTSPAEKRPGEDKGGTTSFFHAEDKRGQLASKAGEWARNRRKKTTSINVKKCWAPPKTGNAKKGGRGGGGKKRGVRYGPGTSRGKKTRKHGEMGQRKERLSQTERKKEESR